MTYKLFNYKGEVLENEISQETLDGLLNGEEFNVFEWDTDIYASFVQQNPENTELAHANTRVYQKIVSE